MDVIYLVQSVLCSLVSLIESMFLKLARRVRVMREARAAPVVQKIEKTASGVGKKVLTALQSFPRGMECIDPLGLG